MPFDNDQIENKTKKINFLSRIFLKIPVFLSQFKNPNFLKTRTGPVSKNSQNQVHSLVKNIYKNYQNLKKVFFLPKKTFSSYRKTGFQDGRNLRLRVVRQIARYFQSTMLDAYKNKMKK